ncbi:hypothetical protein TrVE_jg5387 [Triparma verrucosa]|uniref:Uncharacterized protein n=1 Tax=Triparma verrucosa TaxID=1606542 RepID=A0A9W7B128_9STRA|nr:hypothetical protein TrVE_jg5387 [Triparma verrucosa]
MKSPPRADILPPILPHSPYYNALTSAYVTRAASTDSLIVVDTSTKKKRTKKATRAERKRREKEELARSQIGADRWWEKPSPTLAGSALSPGSHLSYLANDVSGYTGIYKRRFLSPSGGTAVSGDYHSTPRRVSSLLKNSSYKDLNIMDRSADFRNEVGWRLHLRTSSPSPYAHKLYLRSVSLRKKLDSIETSKNRNNIRHVVVDTVGHLLNFSNEPTQGQIEKEKREKEQIQQEIIQREQIKEEQIEKAVEYVKSSLVVGQGGRRKFLI